MTMATKSTPTYVVATTTFHGPDDLTVAEGTIKRSDDPIVKAHPNVFRPVEDTVDFDCAAHRPPLDDPKVGRLCVSSRSSRPDCHGHSIV